MLVAATALLILIGPATAQELDAHKVGLLTFTSMVLEHFDDAVEQMGPMDVAGLALSLQHMRQISSSYGTMVGVDTVVANDRYREWETALSRSQSYLEDAAVHARFVVTHLGDAAKAQGADVELVTQFVAAPTIAVLEGRPPEDILAVSSESVALILGLITYTRNPGASAIQQAFTSLEQMLAVASDRFVQGTAYMITARTFARSLATIATEDIDLVMSVYDRVEETNTSWTTWEALAHLSYQVACYLILDGTVTYVGPDWNLAIEAP